MIEELVHKYKIKSLNHIENKNITVGINTLIEGLKINNKDIDLLNLLGLCLYKKCKFNDARYAFERSFQIDENDKAKSYLDWIESEEFDDLIELYNKGIVNLRNGDIDESITIFKNICKIEKELIEPYCILTEAYIQKEDYREAKKWFNQFRNNDVGDDKISLYKKIIKRDSLNKEDVDEESKKDKYIIETSFNHSEIAEFRFLLGMSYEETHQYEMAIEEYKKYINETLKKSYVEGALYNLMKIYSKLERNEECKYYANKIRNEYNNSNYYNDEIKKILNR